MDSSNKRVKIVGAVLAAVALVAVGVVVLSNVNGGAMVVQRTEALAKYENADVPLANLPEESEVHTPAGWEVESDKAVEGAEEEDVSADSEEEQEAVEDDDIDSPLDVEEDENGQKYVAEMDEDVIVTEDEKNEEGKEAVAADGRRPSKCYKGLKKCGYRKRCHRLCKRRCVPYAVRVCKAKKFCKCFCKYFKNIKKARKCVYYKKKSCYRALRYKCLRRCNIYCNKVPRCYCCARKHVRKACRRVCKKISYRTKCGKCRCLAVKCYKYCRFVCRRYKK